MSTQERVWTVAFASLPGAKSKGPAERSEAHRKVSKQAKPACQA